MSSLGSALWTPQHGGIAAPLGFSASGISAGLKPSGKPDLALLLAPYGAVCAGMFTQSVVRASCVDLCIERLKKTSGKARAVLINSGQANACTGERGLMDSLQATNALAELLNLNSEEVLICSTGVIGKIIPMDNLLKGLEPLLKSLDQRDGSDAAHAILTTDLITKQIAFESVLGNRKVKIGGMAKGSGMIHPNMATMLAFLTCDAGVPEAIWSEMIKKAANSSFNAITVDGDTSTNDSFIAFAAGEALEEKFYDSLQIGLQQITEYLAKSIVRDGEGANCLFQVHILGAENNTSAMKIAKLICSSPLVKTAIHGADPNWGRIAAAAGRAGIIFDPNKLSIWIGPYKLVENGLPLDFNYNEVVLYMKNKFNNLTDYLSIKISIGFGKGEAISWGCDLSKEYITINADYTT